MKIALVSLLAIVTTGCGFGASTGGIKLGDWKVTAITGKIQHDDTGCGPSSKTFVPALSSSWNKVTVHSAVGFAWFLAFDLSGESYDIGSEAKTSGGAITGNVVQADISTTTTSSGTYDSNAMTVAWTIEQHVKSGVCATDVSGSGTFTATPP